MHILIEFNKQKWIVSISNVCNELAEHIRWITNMILILLAILVWKVPKTSSACFLMIFQLTLQKCKTEKDSVISAQLRHIRLWWVEFLNIYLRAINYKLGYNSSYINFWTNEEFINLDFIEIRNARINEVIRCSYFKWKRFGMLC